MKSINSRTADASDLRGTKSEVFSAAVKLFSTRGYAGVGIRDIARAVDIKSASIYNHYKSKSDLLEHIYQYFDEVYYASLTMIDDVLEMLPNTPPKEVFDALMPSLKKDQNKLLRKISLIALIERYSDARANDLISKMYTTTAHRITVVLQKMIDLKVIKPMDTELFASVFATLNVSAAARIGDRSALSDNVWKSGRELLFDLIQKQ